jgi:lambda repressor-like predicted transcriptional regulator
MTDDLARLTSAAEALVSWQRLRDEYLAEGRAQGHSLRALGDAVGMTASGVKKVLDRNAVEST